MQATEWTGFKITQNQTVRAGIGKKIGRAGPGPKFLYFASGRAGIEPKFQFLFRLIMHMWMSSVDRVYIKSSIDCVYENVLGGPCVYKVLYWLCVWECPQWTVCIPKSSVDRMYKKSSVDCVYVNVLGGLCVFRGPRLTKCVRCPLLIECIWWSSVDCVYMKSPVDCVYLKSSIACRPSLTVCTKIPHTQRVWPTSSVTLKKYILWKKSILSKFSFMCMIYPLIAIISKWNFFEIVIF